MVEEGRTEGTEGTEEMREILVGEVPSEASGAKGGHVVEEGRTEGTEEIEGNF